MYPLPPVHRSSVPVSPLLPLLPLLLLLLRLWERRWGSACWHAAPLQVRVLVLVPGMWAQLLPPPPRRPLSPHC